MLLGAQSFSQFTPGPIPFSSSAGKSFRDVVDCSVASNYRNATDHYVLLWWNNADGSLKGMPRDAFWTSGPQDWTGTPTGPFTGGSRVADFSNHSATTRRSAGAEKSHKATIRLTRFLRQKPSQESPWGLLRCQDVREFFRIQVAVIAPESVTMPS